MSEIAIQEKKKRLEWDGMVLTEQDWFWKYHLLPLINGIVSKSTSETTGCPQMFIVKMLINEIRHSRHIYMKQKEGASVQVSGETERESVCECADSCNLG